MDTTWLSDFAAVLPERIRDLPTHSEDPSPEWRLKLQEACRARIESVQDEVAQAEAWYDSIGTSESAMTALFMVRRMVLDMQKRGVRFRVVKSRPRRRDARGRIVRRLKVTTKLLTRDEIRIMRRRKEDFIRFLSGARYTPA